MSSENPIVSPPLTPFIGREWLLQLASDRLLDPQVRLLTLVGPGGIGKTRLSLELGQRLWDAFDQAVYFVDLSSLTRDDQLLASLPKGWGSRSHNITTAASHLSHTTAQYRA